MSVNGREGIFSAALGEISFGRDDSCVVRLALEHVGPRHLLLRCDADGWIVESLDPAHGVFLDGQQITRLPIAGSLPLRLGDPHDGPLVELAPASTRTLDQLTRDFDGAQAVLDGDATARPRPDPGAPGGTFALTAPIVRIGRDPTSNIVVEDLLVSRRHAELRRGEGGRYDIVDLDSHNGTFVNGHRITRQTLAPLDVILVGSHAYRLVDDELQPVADSGDVAYAAVGLSVRLADGTVLLDDVSFSLEPRSMLAVIGPSGSGKSTLMNALTGFRFATDGDVRYGDQSLYRNYDALRRRIGFVPQDDVVHTELTAREALTYAAALRFAADTDASERRRRVQDVIDELGLDHRADIPVGQLSGGQRKRVSVALELLSEPALLFLDEPTSGLDPNYERGVMEILRALADRGRTVVVITHSTQSLRLCDRVLVLAPGGKLAYFGPPQLVAAYFERREYAEVFSELDEHPETDWGARFRAHPAYEQYVRRGGVAAAAASDESDGPAPAGPPAAAVAAAHAPSSRGWLKQYVTLTRRSFAVLASDRRNLALVLAQAPVLGLLMLVALPSGELAPAPASQLRLISQASLVLLVVVLGVTWLGMSNAVREIAKELPIFRRERAGGLSISAYVASKATTLGVVTVFQAAVLVALATADQGGPVYASILGWPIGELILGAALAGIAAMCIGLLISALARTSDRATTILPVVLVFQLVLALGGVFPQIGNKPVLKQLGYVSSARWGFAIVASTSDLNNLQALTGVLTRTPSVNLRDPAPLFTALATGDRGDPSWDHTAAAWWKDAAALLAIAAVALAATGLALRRIDPGRRAG